MKVIVVSLFLVGVLSLSMLFVYIYSLIIFAMGDAAYPGAIARVPKWIFLFAPLVILGATKEVKKMLQ